MTDPEIKLTSGPIDPIAAALARGAEPSDDTTQLAQVVDALAAARTRIAELEAERDQLAQFVNAETEMTRGENPDIQPAGEAPCGCPMTFERVRFTRHTTECSSDWTPGGDAA